MNTLNKEFVPYEESLALKELGFDEPLHFGYYLCKNSAFGVRLEITTNWIDLLPYDSASCKAPTFSQAFRFFREKYELFGEVIMYIPQEGDLDGCFVYISSISNVENYSKNPKVDRTYYKSHQEAELACLRKLIEIVKNKKQND